MTKFSRRAGLGALIGLGVPGLASAQQAGPLRVSAAWTRAAGQGRTGAGYLTITNTGPTPDRLVAARAGVARAVELHSNSMDNGVMRMRPVPAIEVPAGGSVTLQPSGFHLMLIDLTAPLNQGSRVPVTLVFAQAGEVRVELSVEAAGARGPGAGHSH